VGVAGSYRTALREAAGIAAAAAVLGFLYNGVTGKGFFRTPTSPGESVRGAAAPPELVSLDEAQRFHRQGSALFVDARQGADFSAGRIAGAISVPLQQFHAKHPVLALIPRDRTIITYCDGAECNSSVELAALLRAAGYTNVKVFFGGWREWLAHGQPTEP
jgi:rhodanese-related sulfurtransferase